MNTGVAQSLQSSSFDRYSVSDGLPSNSVRALLQDRQGFIWVGTTQGLVRYDGYDFVPITLLADTSTANSSINIGELFEDQTGTIWIGGNEGLFALNPFTNQLTHYRHDEEDSTSLSHNNVFAILESGSGEIWVGTEAGLNRINVQTGTLIRYGTDTDDKTFPCGELVTAIVPGQGDELWIGSSKGLCHYDPHADLFKLWPNELLSDSPEQQNFIRSISLVGKNELWIGTNHGLYSFNIVEKQFEVVHADAVEGGLAGSSVITIYKCEDGRVLVNDVDGRTLVYEPGMGWYPLSFQTPPSSVQTTYIALAFLEDNTGVIWSGGWYEGLYKQNQAKAFRSYTHAFPPTQSTLSHPKVSSVHVSSVRKGLIWIGTEGGGLSGLYTQPGEFTHYEHNPGNIASLVDNNILAMEESSDGLLWLSTNAGLTYLDQASENLGEFKQLNAPVRNLLRTDFHFMIEDQYQRMWLAAPGHGVQVLKKRAGEYEVDPMSLINEQLSHYSVWPMHESVSKEKIWFGTYSGGLNSVIVDDEKIKEVMHYTSDAHLIESSYVSNLHEDGRGNLWVGTLGQGMYMVPQGEGVINHYSTDNGLPHSSISCIQSDQAGRIWIGTYNGFALFDSNSESFYRFSESDGLPDMNFVENACDTDEEGHMYFGTHEGLLSFHPSQIDIDLRSPEIVLTGLDLFSEPVSADSAVGYKKNYTFKHDENYLRVYFSGLHYTSPSENKYAYKLDGIDRDWNFASSSERVANYSNLAPGKYTFAVMAANSDGHWSSEKTLMSIVIRKPYWQTWWYIGGLLLIGFSFLLGLHRYRIYHLLKVERTRQQISADLHDDIGGSLTGLALFLDVLAREQGVDPKRANLIQYHAMISRQIVDNVRDTIWIVNTKYDSLQALVSRMELHANNASIKPPVKFKLAAEIPEIPLQMETRRHLLFIYKEALNNALRHADASQIDAVVEYEEGVFTFKVKDDGVGFNLGSVRRGHGLNNFKDRITAIHATLDVDSHVGEGTVITCSIKLADIRDIIGDS